MGEGIAFYGFAGLMLVSALVVICTRSPITSLLSLLLAMFCMASLFVMLGAYFLAALQLLIYAGAVLVLFLFVLMLLNIDQDTLRHTAQFSGRWLALGLGLLLCIEVSWVLGSAAFGARLAVGSSPTAGTIVNVGRALFHDYLLPFEITSLLILAAILGAVALAQRRKTEDE